MFNFRKQNKAKKVSSSVAQFLADGKQSDIEQKQSLRNISQGIHPLPKNSEISSTLAQVAPLKESIDRLKNQRNSGLLSRRSVKSSKDRLTRQSRGSESSSDNRGIGL